MSDQSSKYFDSKISVADEQVNPNDQITRKAAIAWCCLLPNLIVFSLFGLAWQLQVFGDWQPAGLKLLTSAETLRQVQDVVGIGGVFLSFVLLTLILIPNLLITLLVSAREFQKARSAFAIGLTVCVLLPAVTFAMLTLMQPK